jgi:hypothetical protein
MPKAFRPGQAGTERAAHAMHIMRVRSVGRSVAIVQVYKVTSDK